MKIEVSAIMQAEERFNALAITADANHVYIFDEDDNCWVESCQGFMLWQMRIGNPNRKVYRGIFTIEVES